MTTNTDVHIVNPVYYWKNGGIFLPMGTHIHNVVLDDGPYPLAILTHPCLFYPSQSSGGPTLSVPTNGSHLSGVFIQTESRLVKAANGMRLITRGILRQDPVRANAESWSIPSWNCWVYLC